MRQPSSKPGKEQAARLLGVPRDCSLPPAKRRMGNNSPRELLHENVPKEVEDPFLPDGNLSFSHYEL